MERRASDVLDARERKEQKESPGNMLIYPGSMDAAVEVKSGRPKLVLRT